MNIGKAFAVFQQIESKKYTKDEKYEAIHDVINAATINSITKKQVLNVVSWLFNKQQKYRWHGERLKNLKVRKKMKINAKTPSIKTYTLSHFKIGDVCMGVKNEHYYLVVKSEKEKKQLVDLTENEIIRDAGYMRFIPAIAELNIKDVG